MPNGTQDKLYMFCLLLVEVSVNLLCREQPMTGVRPGGLFGVAGGAQQDTWRRKVREKRRGLPREARSRPHSVAVSLVPWGTPTCSRKPYSEATKLRTMT